MPQPPTLPPALCGFVSVSIPVWPIIDVQYMLVDRIELTAHYILGSGESLVEYLLGARSSLIATKQMHTLIQCSEQSCQADGMSFP